jgi:hypothetical protein
MNVYLELENHGGERGGRILSQLGGFQVSREGKKGEQKGISKGKKTREMCCVHINHILVRVHNGMLAVIE